MEWLIAVAVVGVFAVWYVRSSRQVQAARSDEALARVERRAVALLAEFPAMSDAEIATLLRDELENAREPSEAATEGMVGRVRRTALLAATRAERAKAERPRPKKAAPS